MIDLSAPENYPIVISAVLRFLHHVKQEEGVCCGCFREILEQEDIDTQTIMNEITIFCIHCGDLLFSIQVFETDDDAPITESEVEEVSEFIHDPDFDRYFHAFMREVNLSSDE